jgi:hypothetical protein
MALFQKTATESGFLCKWNIGPSECAKLGRKTQFVGKSVSINLDTHVKLDTIV